MSQTATESPEVHWDRLRTDMETGGPDAVISFITSFPPAERLRLYSFAQHAFNRNQWAGRNFDAYIAVANAGIAEAIRQSGEADDEERKVKLKDFGNMMSYNLTADLAACWPGDEEPRERRHFEEGLRAAENCIRWRHELGKPGSRRAMAYWGKGMHLLSLGDAAGAAESFRASLDASVEEAAGQGRSTAVVPESSFDIILHAGYLGIAEMAAGTPEGKERYQEACMAFEKQIEEGGEKKDDATFGLGQLRYVEGKYGRGI